MYTHVGNAKGSGIGQHNVTEVIEHLLAAVLGCENLEIAVHLSCQGANAIAVHGAALWSRKVSGLVDKARRALHVLAPYGAYLWSHN